MTRMRVMQWAETQDNLKFTMQRQLYGVHMPVRQLMERSLVGQVGLAHLSTARCNGSTSKNGGANALSCGVLVVLPHAR